MAPVPALSYHLSRSSTSTRHLSTMPTLDNDAIVPCTPDKGVLETYISLDPPDGHPRGLGILFPSPLLLQHQPPGHKHIDMPAEYPEAIPSVRSSVKTSLRESFQIGRRSSSEISEADAQSLWQDMLALQQQYHCYRSVRMQLAAVNDLGVDMMPSRACIDLLNASLDELPEEGWRVLEKYWADTGAGGRGRRRWRFWLSS